MPYVFDFDHHHARPPMELKDLLGGKGANLAEMTSVLALPVPPGFTISTDACRDYMAGGWPKILDAEVADARTRLEAAMGKVIGDADDPLLVSVRSGAKFSMPGMMDTVLNLGLNDRSVEGLAKQTGDERFAFDSYRRFIAMYGRIVLELPGEEFDSLFDAAKELAGTTSDAKVPIELLRYLVDSYQQIVERHTKEPFPQDPAAQLRGAIEAVFRSWNGPRAIAYRNRERIVGVADHLAHGRLQAGACGGDLGAEAPGPPRGHVVATGVGRDGEPGRDGQGQHGRHLGQVGALAPEKVLELHRRLGVAVVEIEDVRHGASLPWHGKPRAGGGHWLIVLPPLRGPDGHSLPSGRHHPHRSRCGLVPSRRGRGGQRGVPAIWRWKTSLASRMKSRTMANSSALKRCVTSFISSMIGCCAWSSRL